MKKEKYLQIFNYLKEFSKLRNNPVRDIEAQETQYPEKLWFNDIPNNKLFENVIRPEFNTDNNYWLKIRKPKEPTKPVFTQLSETLELWINKESLTNEDEEPILKKQIEINGNIRSIEDFPEVIQELKDYVEQKWIDDIIEFNEKIEIYEKKYAEFEHLNNSYKQLFRIFNKTQQFGEEYELVIGVGLLNFKENSDSPKIFRHILTQRIDINFEYSKKGSYILVSPNIESIPQIETDFFIDLFEQFDSQNIIDAERAVEKYIAEKNIDLIFNDGNIEDTLQMFAERVSADGNYISSIDKPNATSSKLQISYSPCLILRKRNTRSFTTLYEKIIGNIEDAEDEINISSINDLIGIQTENANNFSEGEISSSTQDEPIYFPKEYNDEQIEIVEKIRRNNKVLVQGPPGTGKSHTIANLICHLLANGKKVLVTAYTKRALEVIKGRTDDPEDHGKLPEEFRNLAVSLLSGDSTSIQDLQSSVNSINDELSRANLNAYQSEIEDLSNKLKRTKEKIASNTNELVKIKEKATRNQEINLNYSGTLTQIAENLEKQSGNFEWYKDDFSDINNEQIHIDLQNYIDLHQNYLNVDITDFEYEIPNTEKLPTVNQVQGYKDLANELLQHYTSKENHILIQCPDFEKLKTLLKQLKGYYKQSGNLQIDFTNDFIDTYLNGNSNKWQKTIQYSSDALKRIEKYNLIKIDKDIEISYPSKKSLKQLKKDAQTLLDYLVNGNPLSGFIFTLKKAFLPKEIKERLYFIDEVRVNGSPCDTKEEFEIVLNDISIRQNINELSELWNKEILKTESYLKKFNYFQNIHSEISKLIVIINESTQKQKEIKEFSGLSVTPFDLEKLEDIINEAEYNHLLQKVNFFKDIIKKAEAYLSNPNCHPIKEKIFEAFKQIDSNAYHECLNQIDALSNGKDNFQVFLRLKENIQKRLPNLFDSIQLGGFTKHDLYKFELAVYFRHAQKEINKLMNVDYEQELSHNLHQSEVKKGKLIAKLAAKKAWYKVVENLQHNRSLRQHLDAWVMAVKKIGRTGRGKRAMKFRKIAQQEMEHCKNSVPCWIMPLYKVAETIQPEQEMYDYVIIDEASQLGPDAIFLLYITKNIIIVGDDKQTSPEYVGVSANSMTPYIQRHLNGIPFSNYYGTEFSFFDHAKFFCDGTTVLQEHFRCMPEIIEFSNKYFYAPDGKGLYPLKQYSENRLEPLKTIFCAKGYTEGRGARIINEPEANEIALTISKLVDDNRYNDKTFGVITLQGNQQASLIENLLLKTIGEQEYHKRKIVCGNSSSFQGDERDIIFLSLVTAHNHNRSALVKPEDERRFNVAVSRAKEQIWLFHSVQLDDLSNTNDLRYKLLDHFKNYNTSDHFDKQLISIPKRKTLGTQPEPYDSWFEVEVRNDIVMQGFGVIPQYEVAKGRYRIDLVMLCPDGTKLAIECDGDRWHGPEQYLNDLMRQKVLERCGWQFFRVRGYEYYTNREKALEPLWNMIPVFEEKGIKPISDQDYPESNIQQEKEVKTVDSLHVQSSDLVIDAYDDETPEEQIEQINPRPRTDKIVRYFNLFKSGTYILTDKEPLVADYVIPIKEAYQTGFLLQCYKSGYVNKVHIPILLTKQIGKEYMNGLNKDGELVHIEAIETEKIIGIYFNENGRRKFKAHLTENISTREQLHLQGYKVIYNDFDRIEYNVLPLTIYNDISRLVFKSFTATGKPVDNNYYESEWSIIKRYSKKDQEPVEQRVEFIPNSLFDNRVELYSTVKIKFLSNEKELKVKLVDYPTNGVEINDGVQIVNIMKPLAASIKGKTIGDRVTIGDTNSEVEIIEIS